MGYTVVHEVGHYLGLLHTFNADEKCSTKGDDGVSDTPLERVAGEGCAGSPRDSCPNDPGVDPIDNFMDCA